MNSRQRRRLDRASDFIVKLREARANERTLEARIDRLTAELSTARQANKDLRDRCAMAERTAETLGREAELWSGRAVERAAEVNAERRRSEDQEMRIRHLEAAVESWRQQAEENARLAGEARKLRQRLQAKERAAEQAPANRKALGFYRGRSDL